jgi:hypothetical protein
MPVKDWEIERRFPEMAIIAPHWPESFKDRFDYGNRGWHQKSTSGTE